MVTFTREQRVALEAGEFLNNQLKVFAEDAVDVKSDRAMRHSYITGTAGSGKSHTVQAALKKFNIPYKIVKGQASLFGFLQNMAVLKATYGDDPIVVVIDDCDKLFADSDSLNAMKEMLGPDNSLSYGKQLNVKIIPEGIKREAVAAFINPTTGDFSLDVSNFYIIVTSNSSLPTKQQLAEARKKSKNNPSPAYFRLEDRTAIRSRMNYKKIDFNNDELWGSITNIILTSNQTFSHLTEEQKIMIIDMLWTERSRAAELNVRTAMKMADKFLNTPIEDIRDKWLDILIEGE
jgi:ABC-type dipeptide/oligopeptide/nickel transport system ATPase component